MIVDILREIAAHPGLGDSLSRITTEPSIPPAVLFAKMKLLWRCNLSCRFCERPSFRGMLSRATVAAMVAELSPMGLKKIHFSGGEVLLHPEIVGILGDCADAGIQVNMTTNGTLLDRDTARAIVAAGVHSVSISLDGPGPETHDRLRGHKGAFKATLRGIACLAAARKKRPRLRVNTVVTSKNVDELPALHALLASLGAGIAWKLIPVDSPKKSMRIDEGRAAALFAECAAWGEPRPEITPGDGDSCEQYELGRYACGYYHEHICYMPWLHAFIDPAGFVYPCCMTRGRMPSLGQWGVSTFGDILRGVRSSEVRMSMANGHPFKACQCCDDFLDENRAIAATYGGAAPITQSIKEAQR